MKVSTPQSDVIVREFAGRVRRILGEKVVAVRWFGSRARGEERLDSDFDLLLETTRPLTAAERDEVVDATIDIEADYDCLLDVHYYTTQEIRTRPFSMTPFVMRVLEEAVAV